MLFTEFVREFRCFSGKPPYPSNDKDLTAKMMKHPSVAGRVTEAQYRLGTTTLFMQAIIARAGVRLRAPRRERASRGATPPSSAWSRGRRRCCSALRCCG